jgi:hypothetical protein
MVKRPRTGINLLNASDEPVYSPVVAIVFIQGAGPRTMEEQFELAKSGRFEGLGPLTTLSILPPGRSRVWIHGTGWARILSGRCGVDIAFTDHDGAHWIRRATGELEELPEGPFTYLALDGPHDLQIPEQLG